jgi:hypothetical protein
MLGEMCKYSYIVVCLGGVGLMFDAPQKMMEYALMTGIGGVLTIIFGAVGHFVAKRKTKEPGNKWTKRESESELKKRIRRWQRD